MAGRPISELLGELKSLGILILIMIALFAIGWFGKAWSAGKEYDLLLTEKNALTESLTIAQNKSTSLEGLLNGKTKRVEELKLIIANLKEAPREVTHVVETVTKLVPEERERIVYVERESCSQVPPDHLYKLEAGLPVASFSSEEEAEQRRYNYETAEIELNSTVVIGDDSTAVLLKAKSSLDPEREYTLQVQDVAVTKIRKHKIFEPHIQVNVALGVEFAPPGADVAATISVPLIHPLEDELDFIAPKIGFNDHDFRLGVDIVGYNLGEKLPVITDLWISGGLSVGLVQPAPPSLDISIGSKF